MDQRKLYPDPGPPTRQGISWVQAPGRIPALPSGQSGPLRAKQRTGWILFPLAGKGFISLWRTDILPFSLPLGGRQAPWLSYTPSRSILLFDRRKTVPGVRPQRKLGFELLQRDPPVGEFRRVLPESNVAFPSFLVPFALVLPTGDGFVKKPILATSAQGTGFGLFTSPWEIRFFTRSAKIILRFLKT